MTDVINKNSKITLHFSLELKNGDVVESTFGKTPATFTMADGSLLPGFEKQLLGLSVGDKRSFLIPPTEGFGEINPQNIQFFKRSAFAKDFELSEGAVVFFADASGKEVPGVIKNEVIKSLSDDIDGNLEGNLEGNKIEVDFNHPLAGRDITFTVEIINVE